MKLLDHGYIELVESWGSDQSIIEAARMSTAKGFLGWGGAPCPECDEAGRLCSRNRLFKTFADSEVARLTCKCKGVGKTSGDEKLLRYLWEHKHATPFEMAGLTIEVKAPIMVFREWHRHRVPFGYNEMSARYVPLPDENYCPTVDRIVAGSRVTKNKQASSLAGECSYDDATGWLEELVAVYDHAERVYQLGLKLGVPKELARLPVPVGRYSRMRATANLRGWLGFCRLRAAPDAQYEIRAYAYEVLGFIREKFPYTHALFIEGR